MHHNVYGTTSVWYRWTAPATRQFTFDAYGTEFWSVMGVYTGPTVDQLTRVTSGYGTTGVTFNAVAGTTYYIAVDGEGGRVGYLTLRWDPPPFYDRFGDAKVIVGGRGKEPYLRNIRGSMEPGEPQHGTRATGASVWLRWTAPVSRDVTISTIGSNFDTVLAVYTGIASML